MNRTTLIPAALLCLTLAAPALAERPVIERSSAEIDIEALRALQAELATTEPVANPAPATQPSSSTWIAPFVVDTENPSGTTTLVTVRVRVFDEEEAAGFLIRFYDHTHTLFHDQTVDIGDLEIQSFNLRDQPGLGASGIRRGFVEMIPSDGVRISADYLIVTPGEDFATGGQAFSRIPDSCLESTARVLVGGPFTGGTRFLVVLRSPPLGTDPAAMPTIVGTALDEAGNFINSYQIKTADWVMEIDAADLILPANLFGYINFNILSANGAFILGSTGAEGRYSVGMPSVCTVL